MVCKGERFLMAPVRSDIRILWQIHRIKLCFTFGRVCNTQVLDINHYI